MIISEQLAQKIVDSTMSLVHRNINIMNRDGVIIATGQTHRYKTRHKGAADVIETGAIVEIYPHELSLYPGSLQGVNLPIVLDEKVVGVVGVFGHPDEVRETARLVKTITELILEREFLQRDMRSRFRLREQLVELAVLNPVSDNSPKIDVILEALALDPLLPRAVILINASAVIQKLIAEYGSSELLLDWAENVLLCNIKNSNLITKQDMSYLTGDKLIILKTFDDADALSAKSGLVENLVNSLTGIVGGPLTCGVGSIAESFLQYNTSYKQALFSLTRCSPDRPTIKIYERDLLVQCALSEALGESTSLAMNKLIKTYKRMLAANSEIRGTVESLLKHNLNLGATANTLHIHRNTLLYRLSRLQTETGLDPCHSVDDIILCRLLLNITDMPSEHTQ